MIVIVGLAVLLVAVIVGMVGELAGRELARSQPETAFLNRDFAILHEHQGTGTDTGSSMITGRDTSPRGVQMGRNRDRPFRPWSRLRRPVISARRDVIR